MGYRKKINLGRWRVLQERGQIDADARPTPEERLETIGQVMPNLMKQIGIAPDYWQEKMRTDWPALVGSPVSRYTRPGALEGVSLTVYVSNNVWLNELKRVGYEPLLRKLQAAYGAGRIRHLKLLMDPDCGRPPRG